MNNIPSNTKIYLASLMEQKIKNHPNDFCISFKNDYRVKFGGLIEEKNKEKNPIDTSKIAPPVKDPSKFKGGGAGGGMGAGQPAEPGSENMTADNILFGGKDGLDPLAFGAAYGVGKVADIGSRFLPQKAIQTIFSPNSNLKKALGPQVFSIVKKSLEGIADLSGASFVDVNTDDIMYQNLLNTIAGEGRPFFKLQVPIRRDDPMDYWRRSYLAQQQQSP